MISLHMCRMSLSSLTNWCWARCFTPRRLKRTSLDESGWQRMNLFRAVLLLLIAAFSITAEAQNLQARANDIRAAMDARDFERAESFVRQFRASDTSAFIANNYEYLLARLLERRGARSEASALYLGLLNHNSILNQYALWHLAILADRKSVV